MSEYLDKVINASGGHAAPAENLEAGKKEAPEGYHYMPDGTLMKDSEHEDEAALEKNADDPCWEGYVQVGMKKGKGGDMVPNCVPLKAAQALEKVQSFLTSDEIETVLSHYNSNVGGSRQVSLSAAAEVASRSYDAYSDGCASDKLSDAILWELHSFLEYATLGASEDLDVVSDHEDLLNAGHPAQGMTASAEARIDWASGAPEFDEASREVVKTALSETSSELEAVHAFSRLRALTASGKLDESTVELINKLATN